MNQDYSTQGFYGNALQEMINISKLNYSVILHLLQLAVHIRFGTTKHAQQQ